jgi:hypothetical protein
MMEGTAAKNTRLLHRLSGTIYLVNFSLFLPHLSLLIKVAETRVRVYARQPDPQD